MNYHDLDLHHQQVMLATGQSLASACLLLEEITGIAANDWALKLAIASKNVVHSMTRPQINQAIANLESGMTDNCGTIWIKSSRDYN